MRLLLVLVCALATAESLETVTVECLTTQGDITIEVYPEWSPNGAQRYLELLRAGFWTDIGLFRSIKKFLVQFGINGDPSKRGEFRKFEKTIKDDPHRSDVPVREGYLSYAGSGPNSRTTQIFIAYDDLPFLGKSPWETPFGRVVKGMDVVHRFYTGYGEKPSQGSIAARGNEYLQSEFPNLDYMKWCKEVVPTHQKDDPTPAPHVAHAEHQGHEVEHEDGQEDVKAALRGAAHSRSEADGGGQGALTWMVAAVLFVGGALFAYTRRTGKSPGEAV